MHPTLASYFNTYILQLHTLLLALENSEQHSAPIAIVTTIVSCPTHFLSDPRTSVEPASSLRQVELAGFNPKPTPSTISLVCCETVSTVPVRRVFGHHGHGCKSSFFYLVASRPLVIYLIVNVVFALKEIRHGWVLSSRQVFRDQ